MAKARKPIEGNRTHEVKVNAGDARAMEVAANAMTGDNVTVRQSEAAGKRLMEVSKRFREADRKDARKAAKK